MYTTFYLSGTGLSFHFKLFYIVFYSFNKYEDLSYLWYKPSDIEFLTPTPQAICFKNLFLHRPEGVFFILIMEIFCISVGNKNYVIALRHILRHNILILNTLKIWVSNFKNCFLRSSNFFFFYSNKKLTKKFTNK